MSDLVAAHDWASTPLGPQAEWPQSLLTVVAILLTSRFAMWMSWGADLTFLYNDAYAPTLGVKHPWALGRPSRDVWAEIWPDIGPRIERVLETGEATWDEALMLFLERSGYAEETYHTFSYSPLRDDHGVVAGHLCVVTEETERVIGARRLGTLRELASALGETTIEDRVLQATASTLGRNRRDLPFALVYLFDGDGKPALAAQSGFADLEHAGRAGGGALWPFDDIRNGVALARITGLRSDSGPVSLPTGDWAVAPTEALALAIRRQGDDRPAGMLVAALNPHRAFDPPIVDFLTLIAGQIGSALANARAYEAERRRAEALAELDRAKTAFFSNVSHEFRTPLTLMLGPLDEALRLDDDAPGAAVRPLIEVANRNAQRLLRLVNALLDFSRIEAGRVEARFAPVDLSRMTADIASAFRSAMEQAGLGFVVDCPDLSAPVHVDRGMWEKIVLNLVSNAFKFTLAGEVRVELREVGDEDEDGDGGWTAELTVRDTGIGIPDGQRDRIFERFHRVEGAGGRSYEGTGIGLALVRDLVTQLGGSITVESALGEGSTFRIRIPFGTAHLPPEKIVDAPSEDEDTVSALGAAFADEALAWLEAAPAAGIGDYPGPPTAQTDVPGGYAEAPSRILLADDNADMRHYVERLLTGAGHEVVAVGDGAAALEVARTQSFDLVLSDVMMPRLDGLGLLRALRAAPGLAEMPVILLSARAGEEARLEGLKSQADDYLVKPFSARELLARVAANLGIVRLRRAALEESRALSARLAEGELRLRRLNETLERRVAERTAERDRIWELSEDLLVVADYDGNLLRVSPSWSRLLGHDAGTLHSIDYMTIIHPDDAARTRDALIEMRRDGRAARYENRVRGADGSYRWISWALSPASDGTDTVIGTGRDVTEERAARAALLGQIEERERVEATLRQMQRLEAVGQLTSGVAHDFNNLLTVILGSVEHLERRLPDPAARRRLTMIQTAARRGAELTAQLLAFSRKQHLDPRALDLNETVRDMHELLRTTVGSTIRVETRLEPDLRPALADRTQLELVVLNLAINARDAMEKGGTLVISTANTRLGSPRAPAEPAAGRYAMISVADTGTGIPAALLSRVFEPFFTTKPPGKGSGLGLAQVYGFAKQSGGGVRIVTAEGEGTEVRVYLPQAESLTLEAAPGQDAVRRSTSRAHVRALVVDDDADVRATTAQVLADLGLGVAEVDGAEAALAQLRTGAAFDVAVLDYAMPDMNGVELAHALAALRPEIKVIMVTGYADPLGLERAGPWPIVRKPFTGEQLAEALDQVSAGDRGGA